ncbi:MAG: hypothetical protein MRJ96_07885 [Nitrospirales bacterium]|nr:hypothetical protein [Nitrospira sp.]MDR4501353.1 hypothetical protein [Nitrospirales bacterium]
MPRFMRFGYMGVMVTMFCGMLLSPPSAVAESSVDSGNETRVTLEGFRSARFGMNVQEVEQAILNDFSIEPEAIQREKHPTQKTENLKVTVDDLLPESGTATLYYIFGFQSKQLIQINVIWGGAASAATTPDEIVAIANQLREHFFRKGFQKEGLMMNAPLGEGILLVFRGTDVRGRMVVLLLTDPKPQEKSEKKVPTLRLSYIVDPDNPDIYRIKDDAF